MLMRGVSPRAMSYANRNGASHPLARDLIFHHPLCDEERHAKQVDCHEHLDRLLRQLGCDVGSENSPNNTGRAKTPECAPVHVAVPDVGCACEAGDHDLCRMNTRTRQSGWRARGQ
jgi:hypothetical protein